jgi:hypothetical protein
MNKGHGIIPRRDIEYLNWARNIVQTSATHAQAWGLPPARVAQMENLAQTAHAAWEANNNPATTNHTSVTAKNAALASLKTQVSLFINLLLSTPQVPDEALAEMHLRPRRRVARQPKPPPADAPVLTIIAGQHHDLTACATPLPHGHPVEHLAGRNHYGFLLKYQFEGDPEVHQLVSTRLRRTLLFDETSKGRYLTLSAAWVNARIEPGPWSEPVRELVN